MMSTMHQCEQVRPIKPALHRDHNTCPEALDTNRLELVT